MVRQFKAFVAGSDASHFADGDEIYVRGVSGDADQRGTWSALKAKMQTALEAVFDGRYAPSLWLGAADLMKIAGAAASGGQNLWPSWKLDADGNEKIAGGFIVPASWSTCDVYFWWTNGGGGAGDVSWQSDLMGIVDGGDMSVSTTNYATATAPVQGTIKRTQLAAGVAVTAGRVTGCALIRDASDSADTLANDARFVGVELVGVS